MARAMKWWTPPPPTAEVELLGDLVYCRSCREWWPADGEFFSRCQNGRFRGPCKACEAEQKARKRQEKKALSYV